MRKARVEEVEPRRAEESRRERRRRYRRSRSDVRGGEEKVTEGEVTCGRLIHKYDRWIADECDGRL